MGNDPVNILIVDDQPSKLISHTAILNDLGENILTANSARQAFEILLKNEVSVILIDVCMPETDGFELAAMIQEHPRFKRTAVIFISAILFDEVDRLRGYEMGAVDYVTVPIIPEVLRAKVKVFVELYRKTQQLEQLNRNLEARVAERTAELAASTAQLRQAEQLRSLALAAGQMGSWEWDIASGDVIWDQGQHEIFGVDPDSFTPTAHAVSKRIHPEDRLRLFETLRSIAVDSTTFQAEFRARRANGDVRSCIGVVASSFDKDGRLIRLSGVTVDITDRKRAEEHRMLLAEEVDHRARNVVAVIQAIIRLTRSSSIGEYIATIDGRIRALSTAHKLLSTSRWEGADLRRLVDEELAPYRERDSERVEIVGEAVLLPPAIAQTIALALHELTTNAAKYGALSVDTGHITVGWEAEAHRLILRWVESNGPPIDRPSRGGYGTRVIKGGIEGQLGGKTDFEWLRDGLRCTLIVPYQEAKASILNQGNAERKKVGRPQDSSSNRRSAGQRILLVEDEPMVSMMLADLLAENGEEVDGPYWGIGEALLAATHNDLKAGILDINLRGNSVYPIADMLTKREIPFVFVTGYAADAIESRYDHIPVLPKPIEPERIWAALAQSSGKVGR
jgi:PAS domain S-box-containing protein